VTWPVVKIEDIFEVARGGSPRPIKSYITDDPDGINWIMIGDTKDGSKYIHETAKKIKKEGVKKSRMVKEGDFLLTNSMSFGRPYILKTSGCIHDGWLVLSPKSDEISTDYFYYFLGSSEMKTKLASKAAGAVVKNLNSDIVRNLDIPLPPINEQKRIAAILDKADDLRRKREKAIALTDNLLRSVFLNMFGDPVTNPKGWDKLPLSQICSFKKKSIKPEEIKEGTRYIGLECIEKQTGIINEIYTVSEGELKSNKFWFDDSYILYGKLRPYLNKVALPVFEGICSTDIIPIRPKERLSNKEFISQVLKSPEFVSFADGRSSGANLPRISPKEVQGYETICPPFELQKKYQEIYTAISSSKEKYTKMNTSELFLSLTQRVFRGELPMMKEAA
jgi:type I restriction enzyme S subunit